MKMISLTACIFFMVYSCTQSSHRNLTDSLWKMRKVEILRNNELAKVIDTGFQYWSFRKPSLIEIFDMHKIQNVLHIKMENRLFRSYDSKGILQDEFLIKEIGDENIALCTTKKMEHDEYNIIYYLDKVKDSTTKEIKDGYKCP